MATKKTLEEDVTKNPQATTEGDVNGQDTATRLWQSLKNTYGNQMEESDKAYDKAISQQNNAMLARGMQRSSYGASISAGLLNQKNQARNRLGESLIASYQDRLSQLEEAEAARKFQADEAEKGRVWQSGENALSRAFTTSEREATQKYNTAEREATQLYNTSEREAQQKYNTAEREAQQLYNTSEREAQQSWQSSENALNRSNQERLQQLSQEWQSGENAKNRAFTTSEREATQKYNTSEREAQQQYNTAEREAQQAYNSKESALSREWQTAENAANRAEQARQYDTSLAYQKERDAVGDTQWDKQFGFNEKTTDQQIAMQYALDILGKGQMPTDDLLARAGLSKEDAQAMMAKTYTGGSNPPKDDKNGNTVGSWVQKLINTAVNSTANAVANNPGAVGSTIGGIGGNRDSLTSSYYDLPNTLPDRRNSNGD